MFLYDLELFATMLRDPGQSSLCASVLDRSVRVASCIRRKSTSSLLKIYEFHSNFGKYTVPTGCSKERMAGSNVLT